VTPARANKINKAVFFAVVAYFVAVCVAVGMGDRGIMAAAGQALVIVPFAVVAAICGALVLTYVVSAVLGVVVLIVMGVFLIAGRKQAALAVSEKMNDFEQAIVNVILRPKDQDG